MSVFLFQRESTPTETKLKASINFVENQISLKDGHSGLRLPSC